MKTTFLKMLATELSDALPSHIGALKKDFEKSCHHVLSQAFTKLDLITRAEFDAQTKVLSRTRKKLETLERELEKMEALLKTKSRKS